MTVRLHGQLLAGIIAPLVLCIPAWSEQGTEAPADFRIHPYLSFPTVSGFGARLRQHTSPYESVGSSASRLRFGLRKSCDVRHAAKPPCLKHSSGGCVLAVVPGQVADPDEGAATPT